MWRPGWLIPAWAGFWPSAKRELDPQRALHVPQVGGREHPDSARQPLLRNRADLVSQHLAEAASEFDARLPGEHLFEVRRHGHDLDAVAPLVGDIVGDDYGRSRLADLAPADGIKRSPPHFTAAHRAANSSPPPVTRRHRG